MKFESDYSTPKQDFEIRRFKAKEGKELNTVRINFREKDNCNKLIAEGTLPSKYFFRPEEYEHSEFTQVTRCYNCQRFELLARTC